MITYKYLKDDSGEMRRCNCCGVETKLSDHKTNFLHTREPEYRYLCEICDTSHLTAKIGYGLGITNNELASGFQEIASFLNHKLNLILEKRE